ncbi:MAG: glycosyltransferase family 4 protein [Candidatus Omnitrophica bacterium]|nr:glycosyltransferase family 4 protein [Candidatus Omnitrophota bacterium]
MNILMVHPHDLFDKSEPWTIRIKSIAEKFVERGHKVKICYFPLTINEKNLPRNLNSILLIPLDRTPSPLAFIVNAFKLISICKWADIVHFQKCHHYSAVPVVLASYITCKPLHYEWDDWEEKIWFESCGRGLNSRFIGFSFRVLERWLPVLADSVSCASDQLKRLSNKFGVAKDYIFDAPVGGDLDKFRPGLDGEWVKRKFNIEGELILYIGQLHGAQYVDLLLKAVNIVHHKHPSATFMIVGEGFLERSLRNLARELGIEDKVIFAGAVSHDEIPYFIAAADVCVASFKDTEVTRCKSPLKIVEYLASGKPIVASNVGEIRKMVGGVGILVEPGDFHSLAKGILRFLDDEVLRTTLGSRARKRAETKYNWIYTAESLLSAYEKILKP